MSSKDELVSNCKKISSPEFINSGDLILVHLPYGYSPIILVLKICVSEYDFNNISLEERSNLAKMNYVKVDYISNQSLRLNEYENVSNFLKKRSIELDASDFDSPNAWYLISNDR